MSAISAEGLRAAQAAFRLGPVDLEAERGEAVAVVGPSGAGKTTLLRALAGFLPLAAGRIRIDGEDCAGRPPEDRGLGYVPQGYALLPHRTVLQNVRYAADLRGARDAEDRAWAMLHRFRLEPLARAYPAQLSGGERQRVAMARALAAEPRLLLWDEPLAALDAQAQDELLDLLRGVLEDERLPLLLVTHDPGTAFSLARRCLVLDGGREAFFGPLEDLLVRPPTPFVARFLGIENVYLRADLEASPSAFARWLGGRAGRQGICVPAERVGWSWDPGEGWKGSLVRVRRTPRGTELWADLDGLRLRATRPGDVTDGKAPARGADVWIRVEDDALLPLEGGARDPATVSRSA